MEKLGKIKSFYATTAFKFPAKWDKYLTKVNKYYSLSEEVRGKLQREFPEQSKKLLEFHDSLNGNTRTNITLMRAFAVAACSFYLPELLGRRRRNFVHSAWTLILRGDPSFVEEEYYRKCGKMANTFPSMAAWRRYDLSSEQKERQEMVEIFRRFYTLHNWGESGSKELEIDKPAWKMKFMDGKNFQEISEHFGYKSKSTFVARFKRYYDLINEMLINGDFDSEPELYTLPIEHEIQMRESIFFAMQWKYYKFWDKRQWYCCSACLDWTNEEIAYEWMVPVEEVNEFITMIDTEKRKILLEEKRIPFYRAPRELTIEERLPFTPRMKMKANENKDLINKICEEL